MANRGARADVGGVPVASGGPAPGGPAPTPTTERSLGNPIVGVSPDKTETDYDRMTNSSMIPKYMAALSNPYLATDQKQMVADMLKRAMDAAKPHERAQFLQQLKDDDPSLANKSLFQIEMQLKQPLVSMQSESEQSKGVGGELAKIQNGAMEAGRKAPNTLGTLDVMERAAKDPNFYSGTGSAGMLAYKRAASALGFEAPEAAASAEVFDKMSKKLVTDVLQGDKGGAGLGQGISNADRDFVNGTVPNLQNTPAGNATLIQIQRRLAQRDLEIARMTREWAAKHNGLINYEFLDTVAKYQHNNPIFADMNIPPDAMKPTGGPSPNAITTTPTTTGTNKFPGFSAVPH
jgi:hypothetical protein